MMRSFSTYMLEKQNQEAPLPEPEEPEETVPSLEEQVQANLQLAQALFGAIRRWLENQ